MPRDTLVGTTIARYRVDSVIGRGGMSVVYLAFDQQLGRRVALKILADELSEDEAFRARFARESQLAAGLEHPNIVPVFEAGETDGLLYIAMRFVEGTDLRQLLVSQGHLEAEHALRLLRPIGAALDIAHRRGLVHRDVKPANILISRDESGSEHPYLSDFGLTKHTTSQSGLTKTGQFMGTIDYVAPEQIQGTGVDGRTDQYSFACVLFQSLTGKIPFERDTDVARLFSHLQDAPPSATSHRADLPAGIDDVLAHGMAKAKEDRYESCSALIEAATSALIPRPADASTRAAPAPTVLAAPPPPPDAGISSQPEAPPSLPPLAPAPSVAGRVETSAPAKSGSKRVAVAVVAVIVLVVAAVGVTLVLGGGDDGPGVVAGVTVTPTVGPSPSEQASPSEEPSPTEPVTPGVVTDDFSDPESGWGTRNTTIFSAEYVRDAYQLTVLRGPAYQELKGHGVSGDVRIEVEATPASDAFNFYGVTCHGIDPAPATAKTYYFLISTEGDYAIGFYDFATDPGFVDLVIDTSPAIVQGAETNRLEATCVQSGDSVELSLSVNGQFVDSVTVDEPLLLEGRTGLAVHVGQGSDIGLVTFDNFVSTEL